MANFGFVYVLSNPWMPDVYKIGYTDRAPMQRVQELSASTSCPGTFEIVVYGEFDGAQEVERQLHKDYEENRILMSREFFHFNPHTVLDVVDWIKENSVHATEGDLSGLYFKIHLENTEREQAGLKLVCVSDAQG